MWLNGKNIVEELCHKYLRKITIKYHSDHRKNRYKTDKKQYNIIFIDEKLAIREIMDSRTTSVHKCRTKLEFK